MSEKISSARFDDREDTAKPITVYDSRENLLIGDIVEGVSNIVARLFGSEVPAAYDGTYVYLAIRLSEGLNRSQTCYAVVSADCLNRTSDLKWVIDEAVEPTQFQLEQSTEEQLGYVCRSITSYDSVEVSQEVDEMMQSDKSLCCGVPNYAESLALLNCAIAAGTSLAVSRRKAYFDSDSDEQFDLVDSIVVVDEQFDTLTYADDTRRVVDRIRSNRKRQSITAAVKPVKQVVAELRELGLNNAEIREEIVAEIPDSGTERKRSGIINTLIQKSKLEHRNQFDSKQFTRVGNSLNFTMARRTILKLVVAISLIILLFVSASIILWQFGTLPLISIPSLQSVLSLSLPTIPSVPIDASVVLLGAATVALLGFAFAVLSR